MFKKVAVSKNEVRQFGHVVDAKFREIELLCQSEIDRVGDGIDAELNSCGRELNTSIKSLEGTTKLLAGIRNTAKDAPPQIAIALVTAVDQLEMLIKSSIDNQNEVKRNIDDVNKLTDKLDGLTDKIADLCKQGDELTDKYQL